MDIGVVDGVFDGEGGADSDLPASVEASNSRLSAGDLPNTSDKGSREDSYTPAFLADSSNNYEPELTRAELAPENITSVTSASSGASVRDPNAPDADLGQQGTDEADDGTAMPQVAAGSPEGGQQRVQPSNLTGNPDSTDLATDSSNSGSAATAEPSDGSALAGGRAGSVLQPGEGSGSGDSVVTEVEAEASGSGAKEFAPGLQPAARDGSRDLPTAVGDADRGGTAAVYTDANSGADGEIDSQADTSPGGNGPAAALMDSSSTGPARSESTFSTESRPAATDGAGAAGSGTASRSSLAQRLSCSGGSREVSQSSGGAPRRGEASPRRSATGGSETSRRSSSMVGRTSETLVVEQPAGEVGEGGGVEEDMDGQQSWRPSATGSSSSGRQGNVSYAWRGSSGVGDSGVAATSRQSRSDSPPPRLTVASRSASYSSEPSNFARRISGPYVGEGGVDDGSGGRIGLVTAMISALPPPASLPPLVTHPDAASAAGQSSGERFSAASYSSPGDIRRQGSQGGGTGGIPNPLPPLPPTSSNGGLTGTGERSKPRAVVSAPAGDMRSASGGAAPNCAAGDPAALGGAGGRPLPMHLMPTHVQPKRPLDECTVQAASQHVRTVWSTSNICGIRSLPNALSPDFRDRLYEELVQATHRDKTFLAPSHQAQLSYGVEGGPLGMPLSVGQKQVARINPLAGMFTQFEYLPSEYDRVKLSGKYERLRHKLAQTCPQEFVVRATPTSLHGAPAFSEFTYTTDPVDSYPASMHADTDLGRSKVVAGPFYPSGRVSTAKVLKGRLDECMMRLCKQLGDDWPNSFLQVFEDRNGSVVASFQMSTAVEEGDLSSYMNTLCKRNHVVATYQLTKDATRWGLVDEGTGAVFYVMWPPWVRHRYLGPHTAPAPNEEPNGRPGTRGSNSSDEDVEGETGGSEDVPMGMPVDIGDGSGQSGALGSGSHPLDSHTTPGTQRRTGVY
ncbi:hypothetical protein VaNZ11_001987 [Volvox africanus]|uniref:Uncharacterized protein n=1 Tax=Volvox africanus TaxID=51714 RepID=A0ABQ5RQU8_9CHLO|nr:hypothetical protein VaNZ11_001987 [Volvox africanus]